MDPAELLSRLPDPSLDELEARIRTAKHYTLVLLRKGPAPRDDEALNQRLQLEHLQYLAKLQTLGLLVLNGPILSDHAILGVSIYAAELEEALSLASADPKVISGYLTVEAIPWMAVSSEAEPGS